MDNYERKQYRYSRLLTGIFLLFAIHANDSFAQTSPKSNPLPFNDMETLVVHKIAVPTPKAENLPAVLDASDAEWHQIVHVNWPEKFPYCPDVRFRIAHNGISILLEYQVTEQQVKAEVKEDNGKVFRDACCEFFLRPQADGHYYNMETNCIGTMLMEVGMKRGLSREMAPAHILSRVDRWASLANCAGPLPSGTCTWQLALVIPCSTFFKDHIKDVSGMTMTGNFYKTGDGLDVPHYVSWSPIHTPNPDFHTPTFFGKIEFE